MRNIKCQCTCFQNVAGPRSSKMIGINNIPRCFQKCQYGQDGVEQRHELPEFVCHVWTKVHDLLQSLMIKQNQLYIRTKRLKIVQMSCLLVIRESFAIAKRTGRLPPRLSSQRRHDDDNPASYKLTSLLSSKYAKNPSSSIPKTMAVIK